MKSQLVRYRDLLWKGALLVFHALQPSRPSVGRRVLVTGDVGRGNGPFTFLRILSMQLKKDHQIALCYARNQVDGQALNFCRQNDIPLLKRPARGELCDLAYLALLVLLKRPAYVVVNAIAFGRHLHLLALRTRVIYYSHSIWHQEQSPRERWILQSFLGHSHQVVTVSKAAYQAMGAYCFDRLGLADRLRWIHNGIDDRFGGGRPARKGIVILTLGTVAWFKNPQLWVSVAERVLASPRCTDTVEFWWAGRGDLLEPMRKTVGRQPRIKFLGHVDEPDALLKAASIYAQVSQFESFGYGICEAMMFGLPCIVTDCGGATELVSDGENGYVLQPSESDLAAALLRLVEDEKLREEMGRKSRMRFLDAFTAEKWKESWDAQIERGL